MRRVLHLLRARVRGVFHEHFQAEVREAVSLSSRFMGAINKTRRLRNQRGKNKFTKNKSANLLWQRSTVMVLKLVSMAHTHFAT